MMRSFVRLAAVHMPASREAETTMLMAVADDGTAWCAELSPDLEVVWDALSDLPQEPILDGDLLSSLTDGSPIRVPASSSPPEATHPLEGIFCHKTAHDPDVAGWCWEYQCRVLWVRGEHAMLQFFSALDGMPTNQKPISLSVLLGGDWIFYATEDDWRFAGGQAIARLNRHEAMQPRQP